jgi:hypothetical protein
VVTVTPIDREAASDVSPGLQPWVGSQQSAALKELQIGRDRHGSHALGLLPFQGTSFFKRFPRAEALGYDPSLNSQRNYQ